MKKHRFMRISCTHNAHCSMKLRLLQGMLAAAFLMICVCLLPLIVSDHSAQKAEEPYDYADMQMDITIAPFDPLKPPVFDAQALYAENSDFRAWLQIPDTSISFPVVQGADNSFYLKHAFSKEYSAYGCLFLDYRTEPSDRNLVVHGHNMGLNRTEMFSTLVHYQDQEYAEEHDTIFYCDPEKEGEERYKVFAVLNLDIYNGDQFNYRQQAFEDDTTFNGFVSYLKDHSIYESAYVPNGEIIILSTCNRAYGDNNRLLICAGRDKQA